MAIGKHIKVGGAVSGGYSSLEEYGNSFYSEAKEKLIRGIAKDVTSMLQVSSSFADTAKIDDVVARLRRHVPDPKKGKQLKNDDKVHVTLCNKLAESINKRYGMDVIDLTKPSNTICNKVGEIIYSLFEGLHSEFLSVSGDVARIIKNLQVLQEFVDSANTKIINKLKDSDETSSTEAESYKELYDALSKEIHRQQVVLTNLTGASIGPMGNSLVTLLEDNDDFKGLVKDLSDMTGTTEFGTKLAFLLNGSANVAYAAELVDKALKEIGMSVKDYKSVSNIKELRDKVYKIIGSKAEKEDVYKLLAAAEVLYKNEGAHGDIVSHLEKRGGEISGGNQGGASNLDISTADDSDIRTMTADENNPFKGRTQSSRKSITKQISDKAQLRKQLFAILNQQLNDRYVKFKYLLGTIGKKIGGEIDLSIDLELLMRQLNNFANSQPDKKDIHIALSGYRKDLGTTWVKHQYMENLQGISEACAKMSGTKHGKLFAELKGCVDEIIDVVMEFNKNFVNALTSISVKQLGAKTGGVDGEDCACGGDSDEDENDREISEKILDSALSAEFGGSFESELGAQMPTEFGGSFESELGAQMSTEFGGSFESELGAQGPLEDGFNAILGGTNKSDAIISAISALGGVVSTFGEADFTYFKTIKKSIREIDYFYRIANIKKNMELAAKEHDNNTENYENILGEEAGYIIDQIQKKYNNLIDALEPTNTLSQTVVDELYAGGHTYAAGADMTIAAHISGAAIVENDIKPYIDGYKFLIEYIRSSKIEMLEAVQALDLYLSKFTKSMQMSPGQIKDFVQVLEQIEIVAKFFTDKSGDNLAGVFEAFQHGQDACNPIAAAGTAGTLAAAIAVNNDDNNIRNKLNDDLYKVTGEHYYVEVQTEPGKFYAARMMKREQAINFVKQIEKAVKSVRSLENSLSTFSKVNTESSNSVQSFMSTGYIFKAFMKYAIASSIGVGYMELDGANKIVRTNPANHFEQLHRKLAVSLRLAKETIAGGVGYNDIENLKLADPLYVRAGITNNADPDYDICDVLFTMAIKSTITKIFAVVGSYTIFNKPAKSEPSSLDKPINPLRQILGGAQGGAYTEVIPDALELYIRLPLLIEWYRSVFDFNTQTPIVAAANPLISVIPDMDSIWGDLCKVIFIEAANITDGSYPTELANRIIKSINNIYKVYKGKSSSISCHDIISEFILEINRRYGMIMREEINEYLNERYSNITVDQQYLDDDNVDYDLVEIEMGVGRKPAPSDRFRSFGRKESPRKYQLKDLLAVAKRFRRNIENNLNVAGAVNTTDASLYGMIIETGKKLDAVSTMEEKYKIVHEQLHGVEQFSDVDQHRIILFHETVITPLTTLYMVYAIMNDFNRFCVSLEPISNTNSTLLDIMPEVINKFKGSSIYKSSAQDNGRNFAIDQVYLDAVFNKLEYSNYTPIGGVNHNNILEELLRKLMNIGCDVNGLTEINFVKTDAGAYPYIDYTKLEEVCSNLFNNAKSAFHQLRKFLPNSLVKDFEEGSVGGLQKKISLFYIQEHLFDRLIGNKYGNGLVDANIGIKNIWTYLRASGVSFSNTFTKLSHWNYDATPLTGKNITIQPSFPEGYAPLLKDGTSINNSSSPHRKQIAAFLNNQPRGAGIGNEMVAAFRGDLVKNLGSGANHQFSFINIYNLDDLNITKHDLYGIIPKLNQLLFKYCNIFIDTGSKKIYKTLIEKFANGSAASNILDAKNINEVITVAGTSNVRLTEPKEGAIIFASIANAIKNLITEQANLASGSKRVYIEESLLNITEYQKEKMRAYLPAFEKEFELLAKKAEFMRECIESGGMNVDVVGGVYTAPGIAENNSLINYTQMNKLFANVPSDARKRYLTTQFDAVVLAARSMVRCILDTQKELNDVPMYFETYVDSIVDYNNRNNRLPFMPISHITHLFNMNNFNVFRGVVTSLPVVPISGVGVGSAQFKFAYGTRGILSKQKISMEFAPGVSALLKNYNSKVGGASTFNDKSMADIMEGTVHMSRWVVDFMYHKQVLCKHDWITMQSFIYDFRVGMPFAKNDITTATIIDNLTCQSKLVAQAAGAAPTINPTWSNTNHVVRLVESDSFRDSKTAIVSCVRTGANPLFGDRTTFQRYNILDLNVVPINIHAMQREVPFVNLFNYAYTFEQLITKFVGDMDSIPGVILQPARINPLTDYINDPLYTRDVTTFESTVYRVMTGTFPSNMSRPKYLNDQLWNKVLLQNTWNTVNDIDNPQAFAAAAATNATYLKGSELKNTGVTIPRAEGYYRYHTKLVRWVEWFAQLQRVTRMLMRSQLEWVNDPVVRKHEAIAPEVTEFKTKISSFNLDDFE
ncbi:MAG: hypothetical protein ACRCZI_07375 [Cetobacterium sp.]